MSADVCASGRTRLDSAALFLPVCFTVGIFILYILLWAYEYMRELLNAASPIWRRNKAPIISPVNARISIVHSGISHTAKLGCLARG